MYSIFSVNLRGVWEHALWYINVIKSRASIFSSLETCDEVTVLKSATLLPLCFNKSHPIRRWRSIEIEKRATSSVLWMLFVSVWFDAQTNSGLELKFFQVNSYHMASYITWHFDTSPNNISIWSKWHQRALIVRDKVNLNNLD